MNSRSFPSPRKPLWKLRFTTQTPSLTLARPKIRLARIEPTKPAGADIVVRVLYIRNIYGIESLPGKSIEERFYRHHKMFCRGPLECSKISLTSSSNARYAEGKIIIEAPAADLQALRAEIECIPALENDFDISKPKRRRSQVILLGLDNEIDKDRLLKGLTDKNHFLCDKKNNPLLEINFHIKARRNTNLVISVDPSCYKRLFEEQGLYFKFSLQI
ncbi:hypothetical protein AVEN_102125-1 [Araneus ventricosus]|uniref:Uncharacterized protein n=1 Tax=Araneus ventricosus TaxID=182803 RepID=A0A4Y2V0P8_ARAVE|nr:hypothetical protein AVEN_102125-1 [Araneus ventricosus]